MKKFFTRIVAATLGIAMAVGVGAGIGVASSKKANPLYATIENPDASITFSKLYSENTVVNGTTIAIGNDSTVTFNKASGSTAPQYYTGGTAVRAYAKNTIVVASESKTIVAIDFTFGSSDGSNAISASPGTWSSPSWTGSSSSVTFTIGGTSGHRRIASISIKYSSGGVDPDPAVLTGIELGGTYPTTFNVGDAFSHAGMTVTAHYDDSSTSDVTSSATFSGYEMETLGAQTVTVSYTENGVTETATYGITINPVTYSVTYANGGADSGDVPVDNTQYEPGDEVTVLGQGNLVKANYDFVGWNDGATTYDEGDTFIINSNKTLTAVWDYSHHYEDNTTLCTITWNLAAPEYTSASTTQMTWSSPKANMQADKASASTATNNYCPPSQNSTRFYKNSSLAISPVDGYQINKIEFTATTTSYATELKNSNWTNASASVDSTTVTITPTDRRETVSAVIGNTTGHTAAVVYYAVASSTPTVELSSNDVDLKTNQSNGITVSATTDNIVSPSFLWSTDDTNISLENVNTSTVTIKPDTDEIGTATVTLTVNGTNGGNAIEPIVSTVTVHISLPEPGETAGTAFTVAQAIEHIDDHGSDDNYYFAKGIISRFYGNPPTISSGKMSYYISDDGTTGGDELEAYKGKGLNNESFASTDDIHVGDTVIIYGKLTKYSDTYEFVEGNYIVSLMPAPKIDSIELTPSNITVNPNATGSVTSLFTNILINQNETSQKTQNDIVWSSSNSNVLSIENGQYTAGSEHRASTTIHASIGGVEYGSATVTIVDPSIHTMSYDISASWTKLTSISVGDVVAFVYEGASGGSELTSVTTTGTTIGAVTDYNENPSGNYLLTIMAGNAEGSYAFKTTSNTYLSWLTGNSLTTSSTKDDASSWTIDPNHDGSDGNWKFVNVNDTSRILQFNSSQPRFACYGNDGQKVFQIYKNTAAKVGSIDLTSYSEIKVAHQDENSKYIRLGVTLSEDDWNTIESTVGISGYGVMMIRETNLENAGYDSIKDLYLSTASNKPTLRNLNKASTNAPSDFAIAAKINMSNDDDCDVVFCAAAYVISENGTYCFISETRGSLTGLLAQA